MKKVNPKWLRHEALHTSFVAANLVASSICDHAYYTSEINPDFNKKIDEAVSALMDAYQLVGNGKENEVKKHIKID